MSPPGQPMEFGPGMSMAPLFEEMPGEAQQGSMKGQGESGGQGSAAPDSQLEMGQQPQQASAPASMASSPSASRSCATGCKA